MLSQDAGQDTRKRQLEAFFSDLGSAAVAGDKAAYTALYATDAAVILPNRAPLLGRQQVGDWFQQFQTTLALVLDTYKQEKIDIIGDVALIRSRGAGHFLVKATGEKVPFEQNYVDVLRYEGGSWQLAYHVTASSNLEPGLWERDWEHE
jgi:ketosteroid isomerase-like protein